MRQEERLQIADLWCQMRSLVGVSFDWRGLPAARSLVTMDAYRDTVFPSWDVNWASPVEATFTAHDRTLGQRRVFTAAEMTVDKLVATLSKAVWFPPVPSTGHLLDGQPAPRVDARGPSAVLPRS